MRFAWLCNRSASAFWGLLKGKSPNEAARNRNDFQRELARYARNVRLQGKVDNTQLRAVELLRDMDMRLWSAFTKRECKRVVKVEGEKRDSGDKVHYCARHGRKSDCRFVYEAWLKQNSY